MKRDVSESESKIYDIASAGLFHTNALTFIQSKPDTKRFQLQENTNKNNGNKGQAVQS